MTDEIPELENAGVENEAQSTRLVFRSQEAKTHRVTFPTTVGRCCYLNGFVQQYDTPQIAKKRC